MFIISSTGHGWREVQDEWDFPRLERWLEYCEDHPPLQMMVEAYMGIKKEKPFKVTEENFGEFVKRFGISAKVGDLPGVFH